MSMWKGASRRVTLAFAKAGLVAAATAFASVGAYGQEIVRAPQTVTVAQQAAIVQARSVAAALVRDKNLPGLSVAVGVGGQLIWKEGFGWSNIEQHVPVSPETRFRIGSVSKLLTSVAVGVLYGENRIQLDAPVQTYIPDFPKKKWPITTRELMAHTSGIRHYQGDEALSNKPYASLEDGLAIFDKDPLLFKPGTQVHYSSYAWNLVGAIVAKISGEPFYTFVRDKITAPIGMLDTTADFVKPIIPDRVAYYDRTKDGRLENSPAVDESYKWSSGGYLSTPSDLVRFGYAVLHDRVLKQKTREMLWAPVKLEDGKPTGRGLDWRLDVDADGRKVVSHNGGSVGGSTRLAIYPEQNMVVAVTSNVSNAGKEVEGLTDALAHVFDENSKPD